MLVNCPNGSNRQCWARPKPGARSSLWVYHISKGLLRTAAVVACCPLSSQMLSQEQSGKVHTSTTSGSLPPWAAVPALKNISSLWFLLWFFFFEFWSLLSGMLIGPILDHLRLCCYIAFIFPLNIFSLFTLKFVFSTLFPLKHHTLYFSFLYFLNFSLPGISFYL